eukprot:1145430-Pelagomonas_calceolata.AAC.1
MGAGNHAARLTACALMHARLTHTSCQHTRAPSKQPTDAGFHARKANMPWLLAKPMGAGFYGGTRLTGLPAPAPSRACPGQTSAFG